VYFVSETAQVELKSGRKADECKPLVPGYRTAPVPPPPTAPVAAATKSSSESPPRLPRGSSVKDLHQENVAEITNFIAEKVVKSASASGDAGGAGMTQLERALKLSPEGYVSVEVVGARNLPTAEFIGSVGGRGLTLAHFRAQLEDLREHIAHVRAQLEHIRATSTD